MQIWNITCGAASGQWHLEFIKCLKSVAPSPRSRLSSSPLPDAATASVTKMGKAKLSESPSSSSSSYAITQQTPKQTTSAITCILPTAQSVYTGDEDGRVVSLF